MVLVLRSVLAVKYRVTNFSLACKSFAFLCLRLLHISAAADSIGSSRQAPFVGSSVHGRSDELRYGTSKSLKC